MRLGNVSEDADLLRLQSDSFRYFLHEADASTGLVRDSTHSGSPSSIAAAMSSANATLFQAGVSTPALQAVDHYFASYAHDGTDWTLFPTAAGDVCD